MIPPNTIIVGGMKCGTTTLQHLIGSHPQCYIAKRELHYFTKPELYDHSFENYCKSFDEAMGYKIIGEKTPSYSNQTRYSDTASQIYSKLGKNTKIIWMLRDPVERAVSQYRHGLKKGRYAETFASRVQDELAGKELPRLILKRGLYADQISLYSKHFSLDSMHYILLEKLANEPNTVLKNLAEYLGVDLELFPKDAVEKKNTSESKLGKKRKSQSAPVVKERDTEARFHKLFYEIDNDTLDLLRDYYAKPNERLYRMLNLEIGDM